MKQLLISVEKSSWFDGGYAVLVSDNGFQWNEVYHGTIHNCKVLEHAFIKIGYKYIKPSERRGTSISIAKKYTNKLLKDI